MNLTFNQGYNMPAQEIRTLSELPQPFRLPFIGCGLSLRSNSIHRTFEKWAENFAEPFMVDLFGSQALVLSSADHIQDVMIKRPKNFRRLSAIQSLLRELGVDGLFSAEGEAWKRQRRLVSQALTPAALQELQTGVSTIAHRFLQGMNELADRGKSIDVFEEACRFTIEVTTQLIFGEMQPSTRNASDSESANSAASKNMLNIAELRENLGYIFATLGRRLFLPFPYWRYFELGPDKKVKKAIQYVETQMNRLIAEARDSEAQNKKIRSMLDILVAARDQENPNLRLNDQEIFGNIMTLMLAGEDTTAHTLTWSLHYLAHNPELAGQARAEAVRYLAIGNGHFDVIEPFGQLPTLEALVYEVLRTRPPGPLVGLESIDDTMIGNIKVPAATKLICLTRLADRTAGLKLEQDRITQESVLSRRAELAEIRRDVARSTSVHNRHLAFGHGPRICPGRGLALLESALLLSHILSRFELQPESGRDLKECFAFVVKPATPVKIRLLHPGGAQSRHS